MDKETKQNEQTQEPKEAEAAAASPETEAAETEPAPKETEPAAKEAAAAPDELPALKAQLAEEQDKYLRLLAEYDNFRKRSQKEKDNLYTEIRAEIVGKFLPVYDNLERALDQPTADEAYKKGVEMTMGGLIEVMEKLGVKAFGDVGDTFDPNMHNAVMHCEDESLGENVLAEIFQKGFEVGGKVVRFAMVRVAN